MRKFALCLLFLWSFLSHARLLAQTSVEKSHWLGSSSFSSLESLAPRHVRELVRNGEEWFEWQYNYLATPHFQGALQRIKRDLLNRPSGITQWLNRSNSYSSLAEQKEMLNHVGVEAGLEGDSLYYPFGGFDILHPFGLSDQIRDVYSTGSDSVGKTYDFLRWLTQDSVELISVMPLKPYETSREYIRIERLAGVSSMAPSVLSRILVHLGSDPKGLYFFEITKEGKIRFTPMDLVDAEKSHTHMLAVFSNPETGQMKRFWYFRHLINDMNSRFPGFIRKLKFQTLLVKAAPDMWDEVKERGRYFRHETVKLTLAPAKRNNAVVITDHRMRENEKWGRTDPPPIWRRGHGPRAIQVQGSIGFGYSRPGENIYIGSGNGLIGRCGFLLR